MLVASRVKVRVAVEDLQRPPVILVLHLLFIFSLRVDLLFALPLAGRCTISAQLLLHLLTELFHKFFYFSALLGAVAP
jgi:hypothetical protein